MELMDLRQLGYAYEEAKVLVVEDKKLLFSIQEKRQDKWWYSLISYDREREQGQTLYSYPIPKDTFWSQRERIVGDCVTIVNLSLSKQIEVYQINKESGQLIGEHQLKVEEEISSTVIIINQRYFLFNVEVGEGEENLWSYYRKNKLDSFYYLCDLEEDRLYPIKALCLLEGLSGVHGLIDEMPLIREQQEEYVVFNACHMEDYEYEEIYELVESKALLQEHVKEKEGLYFIPVEDFVKAIKSEATHLPFRTIRERYLDGWVRYLGREGQKIYYREKDFRTQEEVIYSIELPSLEKKEEYRLDAKIIKGQLFYRTKEAYEEERGAHEVRVRRLTSPRRELGVIKEANGIFQGYIEERYRVISWWTEEKKGEEWDYKEFVTLLDTLTGESRIYKGGHQLFGNTLILY